MAAGNVNTPASLWDRDRTRIGGEWPEALVVLDLRFWSDPIACGRRSRPSIRELAQTWGWKKSRAHDFVRAFEVRTPAGQAPDTDRTPAGQSPDSRSPNKADNAEPAGQSPDSLRTPAGQSPDTGRTALKDTRARSSLVSRLSSLVSEDNGSGDPAPAPWAVRAKRRAGVTALALSEAVTKAIRAIRGDAWRPRDQWASTTDAKPVLSLWNAEDRPDPAALADDLELVARWARESAEAANDIRGMRPDGTMWGKDRSRDVATLCRLERWGDRLAAARAWRPTPKPEHRAEIPDPNATLAPRKRERLKLAWMD